MGRRYIPENLSGRAKKKRVGAAALAVCLLLLVLLIGAVMGRYQRQLRSDASVRALEFYFTSNFLDGGVHTLAPDSTELTFTLGNHADELRFSEVDISYEVTVKTNGSEAVGVAVAYGNANKKLAKDTKQDDAVTIQNLTPNTYTITAVGTGGYSKTLTATIVIPPKKGQLYYYTEEIPGEYKLLTVWNEGDAEGSVTITYTGIPDNTNPNMKGWSTGSGSTGSGKTVAIGAHESKVFRFFSGTVEVTGATSERPK